jgi:hypothetical protein
MIWAVLGILTLFVLGPLLFGGVPICPICDGLMFHSNNGDVECIECGWTRP